jgi:hypothetical protein
MDPDANLIEQLQLAARLNGARDQDETPDEHDVWRLAELVEALNEWIMKGGALPTDWMDKNDRI